MAIFFKTRKNLFIYLFLGMFLTSCQAAPLEVAEQPPVTAVLATATLQPTNHIVLTPTPLPTATIIPTTTYIPYPDSPALVNFLITKEDVLSPEVQRWDFIPGIIDSFLKEGSISIRDKSFDVKAACPIECTKQSWTQTLYDQVHRHVEITMIRMKDDHEANEKAAELFGSFSPYHIEYGMDEYKWINAPTQNSHIGFSDWNRSYVLATAKGPIALLIVSKPSPYSDDGLDEVSLMAGFANLQFNKLKNENLIP